MTTLLPDIGIRYSERNGNQAMETTKFDNQSQHENIIELVQTSSVLTNISSTVI